MPSVYHASRLTTGNRIFPANITVDGNQIRYRKNRWFGSTEEAINCQHVSSVRATHGMIWSNLIIETSGGSQPIQINGLSRTAAESIEAAIREAQAREAENESRESP
jgi:hypothetical protein